jgi:epoxide hydrolase-like predicted phosphatase
VREFKVTDSHQRRWPTTKAVVFDMGGVLIDLHTDEATRELIEKYGLLPQTFATITRSSFESDPRSITELAMVGRVGTAEYLDAFLHECSLKDLDGLRRNRLAVVGRERASVFAIVKDLKQAGFTCCVLSNTIALHWGKLNSVSEYPSLALFDHVFVSHLIRCAKPEESSFSFVAAALGLPMSQCLLIDDTPLNVDRARAIGWQALLFSDAARLQRDLDTLLEYRHRHIQSADAANREMA